jgi:hypothetical protein
MDSQACKTDICNRTLSLLREQALLNIDDHDPSTDVEKILSKWWDASRMECLIDVKPIFAIRRAILNREKDVELATEEYHAYHVPHDCLEIMEIAVGDDWEDYLLEGEYIYSKNGGNSLLLRYLGNEKELKNREIKFNTCLSYYLAFNICSELVNSSQLLNNFLQLRNIKQSETRTYYLKQQNPVFIRRKQWRKW